MRATSVVFGSVLVLGACAHTPSAAEREAEASRIGRLADVGTRREFLAGTIIQVPVRRTPDGDANTAAERLRTAVAPADQCQAAFDVGSSGSDFAPEILAKGVGPDASPEVVAAAAAGLCACKSAAAEAVLVDLALRPSRPPVAVESLFSYYRWRGADKPAPATLPDARLLEYADHATATGRAALGHLGRAIKDPALLPALERLSKDPDFEVRRAAALGLADGPPKTPREKADADRCLVLLTTLLADADQRVVASACRAVASYDDPRAAGLLSPKLSHADFNVRVAALEGLGKRKAKDAIPAMAALAKSDPSTSARYAAATQILAFDAEAAQPLVDGLLADANEYVRCAGVEVLAKSEALEATARLATIAVSDPHVRVRETAVGAFEGKKDSQIAKDAVRKALADADVGIVSTACGVVGKNGAPAAAGEAEPAGANDWKDMAGLVEAVIARFPGCLGADAREAAISCLSELDAGTDRMVFELHRHDSNPAVRAAAEASLAKLDGKKDAPPPPPTRGADLTGELLPGGAPIFGKDVFLVVETDEGTMKIRLFPDEAPVHCAHVASVAMAGRYDGLSWHRVVPDFVIQGGCPRGDGSGNAGVTLPLEPTRIPFERGTLGMPRSNHPDTGGCQLFICHSRAPHLDVHYTAFGRVVEGLDVIDKIDVDSKIVRVTVEGER